MEFYLPFAFKQKDQNIPSKPFISNILYANFQVLRLVVTKLLLYIRSILAPHPPWEALHQSNCSETMLNASN
jgi:hypothetical protein